MEKARLVQIRWDARQKQAEKVSGGKQVDVQFNPQSLKLTYANENKGGDQPGGNARQFVGSGTSKLSVELIFDTTADGSDVRKKTKDVVFFIQATPQPNQNNKRVPPGLSFEWGSFIFRGIVDSLEENLDYFSEEGVPLRATISISMSRQEIEFIFGTPGRAASAPPAAPGAATPGTAPLEPARPDESLPEMAGRNGNSSDWKAIAAANNIDDPLRLSAGALVNLNVGAGASAGFGAGVSGGISAGVSGGISAGAGASAGIGIGGGIGSGAAVGFSAGLGGGVGFSAGAGAGLSAGASIGGGIGGGISAGVGGGISGGIGGGIGGGAGFSAGASAGASASLGGGFSASAGVGVSGSFGSSAASADIGFGVGVDLLE